MTIHVGINGFARMGCLGLRAGWQMDGFEVVQVNETVWGARRRLCWLQQWFHSTFHDMHRCSKKLRFRSTYAHYARGGL